MRSNSNLVFVIILSSIFLVSCGAHEQQVLPTTTSNSIPTLTLSAAPTSTPFPTATFTLAPTPTLITTFGEEQRIDLSTDDQDQLRLALWYYPPDPSLEKPFAVLLGHESGAGHWNWYTLHNALAAEGYHVFSLDFRGHGDSDGVLDYSAVGVDVRTAVKYINAVGFDRVACLGASMGGSGCLAAAKDLPLVGLGMFSSPMNIPETSLVTYEDLEEMAFPKLFVIAEEDPVTRYESSFVTDFVEMAERSPVPKQLHIYPGDLHGTALFWGDHGEEIQQILFDFISRIAEGE